MLVIFAPTACGKTALSVELFGHSSLFFKNCCEAVSADSMAVYRDCTIATAKPTEEERKQLPYHLIDIRDPDQQYSCSDFVADADNACTEIFARGKLPIVVGGTGFYLRSFILGLPITPPVDLCLRNSLTRRIEQEGSAVLYRELQKFDPDSAKRIHPNDGYRIQRALEVYYGTGNPLSSFPIPIKLRSHYDFCTIILSRSREELYRRINERVDDMFDSGLVEEYKKLRSRGYSVSNPRTPALQAIGYRELADAEKRGFSPDSIEYARDQIKKDSRKYAKKQETYVTQIPESVLLPFEETNSIITTIKRFMNEKYFALLDERPSFDDNIVTF